jgi:hypothetical protein
MNKVCVYCSDSCSDINQFDSFMILKLLDVFDQVWLVPTSDSVKIDSDDDIYSNPRVLFKQFNAVPKLNSVVQTLEEYNKDRKIMCRLYFLVSVDKAYLFGANTALAILPDEKSSLENYDSKRHIILHDVFVREANSNGPDFVAI